MHRTMNIKLSFRVVVSALNVERVLKTEQEFLIRTHEPNFFVSYIDLPHGSSEMGVFFTSASVV